MFDTVYICNGQELHSHCSNHTDCCDFYILAVPSWYFKTF